MKTYFVDSVTKKDIFGKAIGFTHNGQDTYKTFIGGCTSIIVAIIGSIYTLLLFYQLGNKKFVTNNTSVNYFNFSNEESVKIKNTKMSFGFGVTGFTYEQLTDPTYFTISFIQTKITLEDNVWPISYESIVVPFVRGSESNSSILDFTNNRDLDNYVCPQTVDDLMLEGQWGSTNVLTEFDVIFTYGDQDFDSTGVDKTVIEGLLEVYQYNLLIVNSYFDSMDFVNPIKTNLFTDIYGIIEFDKSHQYNAYMSHDYVEVQDSIFDLLGLSKVLRYLSVDTTHFMLFNYDEDYTLFHGYFNLSNKYSTSTRSTLNIIDILGIAGGFVSILSLFGGLFLNSITQKLYFYHMNSELNNVEMSASTPPKPDNEEDKFNNLTQVTKINSSGRWFSNDRGSFADNGFSEQPEMLQSKMGVGRIKHDKLTSQIAQEKRLQMIKNSWENMKSRRRYNYTSKDIFYNMFCCGKYTHRSDLVHLNYFDRYQMYVQGCEKINKEFDAINFAKHQRKISMYLEPLIDSNEQFLGAFNRI